MANTYTWSFPTLTAYPTDAGQTDVVHTIHWVLTGTDGTHTASIYDSVNVTYTAGDSFTSYADLTEAQVQGWTEAALGDERVIELKASLDAQIVQLITPTSINLSIPWAV